MKKTDGVAVFAFDKNGKKLLLVKRRDVPIWVVPGGGLEIGESPKQGAIRETKEESGFDIRVVRKIAEYSHKKGSRKIHIFESKIIGGKAQLNSEAKEIVFFELDNLPELCHPFIFDWLVDLQRKSKGVIKREIKMINFKHASSWIYKHPIIVLRYLLTKIGIHINT